MSHFIKSGNSYRVHREDALEVTKILPTGNYTVKENPMDQSLFLEGVDGFSLPSKVYGNTLTQADRIINTFNIRPSTTGVLLSGEKGSGKTMLAKMLSIKCGELGYPTIIINKPWKGDVFNQLIQNIDQPAVVLFDEFEKVYDSEEQNEILTLLDGVYQTRKLFVMTCNDKWRINQHMRNRPGRVFYFLEFKGITHDFIRDYCKDELNNKDHTEMICKVSSMFGEFNFDLLKALVEEMNRYNETPIESLKMLNAKPGDEEGVPFSVALIVDGVPVPEDKLNTNTIKGVPLGRIIEFWYDTEDKGERVITFDEKDIKKIDGNGEVFVFANENGSVTLTRNKAKAVDFYQFLA